MAKVPGPVPEPVKRRRNKDELAPIVQGSRRGKPTNIGPDPSWPTPIKNYFNAAMNSGQSDWLEPSDVMALYIHAEFGARIWNQSRLVPVYKEAKNDKGDWVPVLDEDGEPVPELDKWGEPMMRTIGSVSGQTLKAWTDQAADLLITEGARRKLRIDLAQPSTEEEDEAARIVAEQRRNVGRVVPIKKTAD